MFEKRYWYLFVVINEFLLQQHKLKSAHSPERLNITKISSRLMHEYYRVMVLAGYLP